MMLKHSKVLSFLQHKTRWLLFSAILFFLSARIVTMLNLININLHILMISSILSHKNSSESITVISDEAQINPIGSHPNNLYENSTIAMASGLIEYSQGNSEQAISIWQQADIVPAIALKLRADEANARGYIEVALDYYLSSIQFDPNNSDVWFEVGAIHELNGNVEDAIQAYENALALNSRSSVEPLGSLYNELGAYESAIYTWEFALAQYPNHSGRVVWWRNLMFSMRSVQVWQQMLPAARAAVEEFPADAQLYVELGFALQNNSQSYQEAADAFKTAIILNADLPAAYAAMGNLMAQNEEYFDAINWYSEAILRAPDNVALYILRANMARASDDFEQALELYDSANGRFPNNARILHEKAWILRQNEQREEALAALDQAMLLDNSNSTEFLLRAGLIFEWAGEKEQAMTAYQEVLSLDPKNEVALTRLDILQP